MIDTGDLHIVVVVNDKEAVICCHTEDEHRDCRSRRHSEWDDLIKLHCTDYNRDDVRLRVGPCPKCIARNPRY